MKRKHLFLIICIVLVGFWLRVANVSTIPPGLNRDEAAIGYTAYSLLKTGRDEYGMKWPLSLKSFGDWKLPLYVYATIPSVAVFGLTEFAVRLPSVFFGVVTVGLVYFITEELFKKQTLALIASGLLAVSPWHVFFSRVASEANLAVFFIALASYLFLISYKNKYLLFWGTFFLSLTLLTYHGNHVFTPLIAIAFAIYFRKQFVSRLGFISLGLFCLITLVVFSLTLFSADKTKISGLFSLNDPSLVHEQIVKNRFIYTNSLLARIFNNKGIFLVEQITQNYLRAFSPEFLFIRGGGNNQHNIPDFGNVYVLEAPFILLGLYFLFAHKEKSAGLLLYWILISALGASLTKDAPHSARQFAIFPALPIVTAYGIEETFYLLKKGLLKKIAVGIFVVLFFSNISLFIARYFVVFPYKAYISWGDGYKELITKILANKNHYAQIFISRPDYSPYIYYLFYQRSDPAFVQKTLVRYPPTNEGFEHVKSFDGINYQKISWADELLLPNRLYIDWAEGVPTGATSSAALITKDELAKLKQDGYQTDDLRLGDLVVSHVVDIIRQPNQDPLFYIIETKIASPSAMRHEI